MSVAGQWQPGPSRVTRAGRLPGISDYSTSVARGPSAALAHYVTNARRLLTALRGSSCIVMVKCIVAHRKQQLFVYLMLQFYKNSVHAKLHAK